MSMIEFNKLMTHSLSLRKRQRDGNGDFSDISSSNVKGFVQFGNKIVIKKDNETFEANTIIFLKDDCGIDISHPYWMIDQTAPQSRLNMEVLKIDPVDDPRTGLTHHFECIVI
jgi:hypothetical protein